MNGDAHPDNACAKHDGIEFHCAHERTVRRSGRQRSHCDFDIATSLDQQSVYASAGWCVSRRLQTFDFIRHGFRPRICRRRSRRTGMVESSDTHAAPTTFNHKPVGDQHFVCIRA
jgi:hypothetical protein